MSSRAHLFYSPKANFTNSKDMEQFVKTTTCRRRVLISQMGGSVERTVFGCCDICSSESPSSRLKIFAPVEVGIRKRRRAVRTVDIGRLEDKLKVARAKFLERHPGFQMLGIDFVCPDSIIKKVSEDAKFIVTTDDFPAELRAELKEIFLSIIISTT